MATRRAVANGNWSATGTWNGGVVPTNGDTVYANGFNVTINQDIDIGGANNPTVNAGSFVSGQWYEVLFVGTTSWTGIGAASNTAGTIFLATGVGSGTGTAKALATLTTAANTPAGAAAGGGFAMSTVYAMSCDCRAGTTTCLNITATTGTILLSGIRVVGGAATNAHAINNNSSAALELSSGTYTGGTTNNANAINNASTGTVNVTGACTFLGGTNANTLNNASTGTVNVSASCTFTGGSTNGIVLNNASTGTVNVSASCTFTGGGASSNALNNNSTGTINVSAPCTFTGSGFANNSSGLSNASTGTVVVTQGTFTASAFSNACTITNITADVRLSGDFLDHWSGWKAVSGGKWRLGTAPTLGQTRYALAGTTDSYFTMYGADNGSFGNPIAANVRSGVSYGGGNLTGTCAVPAAGSVALGVPVDATTGTAVLTPEAVWGHASRTITGGTVDTLTNPPTVPTVVQIRQEMDSNSTKLANLDTTVSSRLSPSGTLATVTNLTNAPASVTPSDIWSHATRTITGGTVDTLTNAPTVPSAASIRAEIDSNSTQLAAIKAKTDLLPASPAATGDIPSANISAIKAKTDLLETTRLAQCSTVSTTGAQLAAALS
jgi:hypothetical protein